MGSLGLGVYYVILAGCEEEFGWGGAAVVHAPSPYRLGVDSIIQLSPRKCQKLHLGWSRVQKLQTDTDSLTYQSLQTSLY